MNQYEALDCTMFWPGDPDGLGHGSRMWRVEIQLPSGPEIWDDPAAGMLVFDGKTMEEVLEKVEKILPMIGFKGVLFVGDLSWITTYVVMDFTGDGPQVKRMQTAIERENKVRL